MTRCLWCGRSVAVLGDRLARHDNRNNSGFCKGSLAPMHRVCPFCGRPPTGVQCCEQGLVYDEADNLDTPTEPTPAELAAAEDWTDG